MIPILNLEFMETKEDEDYFVDDNGEEGVIDINSLPSSVRDDIPLMQLYAQREQEMVKALEFGQNLLKRVRYLENQLLLETTEKDEHQKAKGYLEEENDNLKYRIEKLEETIGAQQLIDDSRKERNKLHYTCKELGQEIEKLQQESNEKESIMEKFSQMKEQSIEYKYKNEELKEEISKLTGIIHQHEEKQRNEEKRAELFRKNSEKNEKAEVEFLKKQISDLQQKMEKYQAERDMAHVQSRVRINELKQGMEELQENEKKLKEILEKKQPPSKIIKAHNQATECSRELRNFKTQFLKDSASISQSFDELASALSSMTGHLTEHSEYGKKSDFNTSIEMTYAILQKKIIGELGLDEFFATGGKKRAQVTKKGWLRISTSYFNSKLKWVKISNSGICIYMDESEKTMLSCYSLANSTLKLSSKNTTIFEIVCNIGKERMKAIHATAKNENERNEWCAFISRTLEIIT